MRPFVDGVTTYAQAGWPCIVPVPVIDKHPPPVGFTGADGRDTDAAQLVAWAGTHADWSIALRMPDGIIGIDVDHYHKPHAVCTPRCPVGCPGYVDKRGGDTLAELVQRWGPLPPTWISSARKPPSGIWFYRVPPGRYRTVLGDAIEIIQRHHRYAVVWPSLNPEAAGAPYGWSFNFEYEGDWPDRWLVPGPHELPWLPAPWVEGLREGATIAGPAASDEASGRAFLAALQADERLPGCGPLVSATQDAERKIRASSTGTRHDTMAEQTYRLVQLGGEGHPGAALALTYLESLWSDLTSGEHRGDEFDRMLTTAARKTVTRLGRTPVPDDPCKYMLGLTLPAPAPGGVPYESGAAGEVPAEPIEAPSTFHPVAVIGAHLFDPRGHLDQVLGDAVLDRVRPVLRYAPDARTWLLRGVETWDTRADLAEWAISLVAPLMPHGDPNAEKGSEAQAQAVRRARLMTAAPSGAIAKKMRAAVAGGSHPSAVNLGDLDREPWVLWAGGVAWDLRRSAGSPTLAQIDPGTPHRHSAGVRPTGTPTPLWDAFTAAVWPDPELRAWALRVLSICLTGYSDKALPVLVGERDRGKTQAVALLMSVLGTYAHAADPRLLGSEIANTHASIVYALMGRRLSFIDEGPREGKVAAERLKQLTGGGELTANAMNQNPVTWTPTHTLVLTANDEPTLTDPAVRGRVRLIPCVGDPAAVIATRRAIGNPSGPAWRAEAPGVLAAMMREAALWLTEPDTASTAAAPAAYRYRADEIAAEQDPVNAWLDAETEPFKPGERANVLYEAFRAWCYRNGVPAGLVPNWTKWGRELTRRGYPSTHDRSGKVRPLRLRGPGGSIMPITPTVTGFMGVAPPAPIPPTEPENSTSHAQTPNSAESANPPASPVTGSGSRDGSVTTLDENRSQTKSLVNPSISSSVTSVTSTHTSQMHTHARTHTHGDQAVKRITPVIQSQENPEKGSDDTTTESEPVTLSKREQATAKRRAALEIKRRAAVEVAAGPWVALPATVDRAGLITPVSLADAGRTLAGIIERSGALTIDVETTGYPVGHDLYARRLTQLGDDQLAVVLDGTDPHHDALASLAISAAPRLHAHSATADLGPLVADGVTDLGAWQRMYDTVIPAKLADPTSTDNSDSLKQLAGAVLRSSAVSPSANAARGELFRAGKWLTDTEITTPAERSGWAQADSRCATMVRYAASDVLDTAALVKCLPAIPDALLDRERAVQRITARITHYGLPLDGDRVRTKLAEHTEAKREAEVRSNALTPSFAGTFNPGSDQQVGAALIALGAPLPRTPTGRPSVAVGALEAVRGIPGTAGALVAAVLDYRHHETVCSTFLEPYRRLVEHGDGRVRPTIYTLGADTGRMSCVRPNCQNVPRVGGVRACICADPGYTLISADLAGVELCVAAALSGDANLARILAESAAQPDAKIDLHWIIAREVFGPGATKGDRYAVKRGVFGHLYGGSVPTLARQVGVSESVMASAVDVLRAVAPGVAEWSRAIRQAVQRGATQFPSYSGRIIWLPAEFPHKAPNYAIQGTARELLVDSLIRYDETPYGGGVVLPVHDEIVSMVRIEDAPAATAALVQAMTSNLMGIDIRAQASEPSVFWQDAA